MLSSVGAIYDYNRARSNEHAVNKFSTALGLSTLAAGSLILQHTANENPKYIRKFEYKTGKYIEKVQNYIHSKYNKLVNSENGKKIIEQVRNKYSGFVKSDFGSKITEKINSVAEKFKSEKNIQKITNEISKKWHKFTNGCKVTKGKYALVAAGIGLVSYLAHKIISNYFKKEGAIDQKYKDMNVMNNILV